MAAMMPRARARGAATAALASRSSRIDGGQRGRRLARRYVGAVAGGTRFFPTRKL
jgi:hypothetical protein